VALLALFYVPLVLMPGPVAMVALTAVAGVFLAPCIACAFIVVDRHAPPGTVTEAFSWLVTTFMVGSSVGTAVAGPVVEWAGTRWGFAVPAVTGTLALVVLLSTARVLAEPRTSGRVARSSENDPNRAVEPRFSSGDRA
jgi:MFS family permease